MGGEVGEGGGGWGGGVGLGGVRVDHVNQELKFFGKFKKKKSGGGGRVGGGGEGGPWGGPGWGVRMDVKKEFKFL